MVRKNDVKIKVASTILASSLMATFISGCKDDDVSVLDNTILDNTVVVTFSDDSKDIATTFTSWGRVRVYKSVVSEICYQSNDEETHDNSFQQYDIVKVEQISAYIVEDDIELLRNKDTKEEAVYNIIGRVLTANTEDTQRTR
ncbi:MAG: hypothetical protein IKX00_03770 [Bacilli bacterium]|nr:hypothetical protein [Bacilli bacterium]